MKQPASDKHRDNNIQLSIGKWERKEMHCKNQGLNLENINSWNVPVNGGGLRFGIEGSLRDCTYEFSDTRCLPSSQLPLMMHLLLAAGCCNYLCVYVMHLQCVASHTL